MPPLLCAENESNKSLILSVAQMLDTVYCPSTPRDSMEEQGAENTRFIFERKIVDVL